MSAEELYIAEAEIARLRSDLAVEKINNKRLQSERNNAEAVCDSYANEGKMSAYSREIEGLVSYKHKLEADIARLRQLLNAADVCLRDHGLSFDSAIRQEIHRELKSHKVT